MKNAGWKPALQKWAPYMVPLQKKSPEQISVGAQYSTRIILLRIYGSVKEKVNKNADWGKDLRDNKIGREKKTDTQLQKK